MLRKKQKEGGDGEGNGEKEKKRRKRKRGQGRRKIENKNEGAGGKQTNKSCLYLEFMHAKAELLGLCLTKEGRQESVGQNTEKTRWTISLLVLGW